MATVGVKRLTSRTWAKSPHCHFDITIIILPACLLTCRMPVDIVYVDIVYTEYSLNGKRSFLRYFVWYAHSTPPITTKICNFFCVHMSNSEFHNVIGKNLFTRYLTIFRAVNIFSCHLLKYVARHRRNCPTNSRKMTKILRKMVLNSCSRFRPFVSKLQQYSTIF